MFVHSSVDVVSNTRVKYRIHSIGGYIGVIFFH